MVHDVPGVGGTVLAEARCDDHQYRNCRCSSQNLPRHARAPHFTTMVPFMKGCSVQWNA